MPLVVHGHFYQPPRENPWTDEVAREPSAAPFHDWNQRINAECYRPNAYARVVDERERVVSIVNNYSHLSFDVGPTLTSWLSAFDPGTLGRITDADAKFGGGIAQAYFHVILPLATERDARTLVRWGLAEFEFRFGRRADGLWLPETAVNEQVLRILAEEGVGFTILAPTQATAVRPFGGSWTDVDAETLDTTRAYRWSHPDADGRGIDLLFYDGGLSHSIAFELGRLSSEALIDGVVARGAMDEHRAVVIAADGETFGHHHVYGDRLLAYALAAEAPRRGLDVVSAADYLRRFRPQHEVRVRESAWSCAHGVGRWVTDCGCSTGGEPGWNQRWRAPLRAALDIVREHAEEVFDRRGREALKDPWRARDSYVQVMLGAWDRDVFLAEHATGDVVEAARLLELARHALAMYTSCGWFFNDLAGIETTQVLRYAGLVLDLLRELGEEAPVEEFFEQLGQAASNDPDEGDGIAIWGRHVEPARVTPDRVVAHIALMDLLERHPPGSAVAVYDVTVGHHAHADRGSVALCTGVMTLTHKLTGAASDHAYAALHLGGLEVLGTSADAADVPDAEARLAELESAFAAGIPVTVLLRMIADRLGPGEFGLHSALPDAAEQILEGAASALTSRFVRAYEQLLDDHHATLVALNAAGYPLPPALRAPAELALARRLEAEVIGQGGSLDPRAYDGAVAVAQAARANGVALQSAAVAATLSAALTAAAEDAVRDARLAPRAVELLETFVKLEVSPPTDRAQEVVYDALAGVTDPDPRLALLADRLRLAT